LNIFAGLITFNLFSESVNNAPALVLLRPNFVTKIVFPLHILAIVNVNVAAFHAGISLLILIVFQLFVQHSLPLTLLILPLIWLPFLMVVLALSWLLSAIGVFFRDLSQITVVATSLLMFLSAVFYPLSALPAGYKFLIHLNPLALVIEQTRRVMIDGRSPSILYLLVSSVLAFISCELSLRFFQRARRDFADVI
jgi:lipopolysaccharide transport system permease protein